MKKVISVILCLVMLLPHTGILAFAQSVSLPEVFDLRDRGVVTPVKDQSPFGTCWSFAAIAASEISILSELGLTYEEFNLDLSERHLAWFAYEPITEEESPTQAGEGCYFLNGDASDALVRMNFGGGMSTSTSIISSGIGPVFEEDAPYHGKNMEIINNSRTGEPMYYSGEDDWSLDPSMHFMQSFELEGCYALNSPAKMDEDCSCYIDGDSLNQIKKALYDGNGVEMAFYADTYLPNTSPGEPLFINTDTWAHWTSEWIYPNHAVCIVGWDDNYPKENFLKAPDGSLPEGDGAWIVKNSWGAKSNEFPNKFDWGNEGYFYLSYYDRSAMEFRFFDYNVSDFAEDYYYINQYDFMPDMMEREDTSVYSNGETRMINVFKAEDPQRLRAISCENAVANIDARIEVFLLDEDYTSPINDTPVLTLNRHLDYAGYHKIKLDEEEYLDLAAGQNYSVAVTLVERQEDDEPNYWVTFDVNTNQRCVEELDYGYYFKGIVNPGESYIWCETFNEEAQKNEEEIYDLADVGSLYLEILYEEDAAFYTFDNLPIKTYCDPIDAPDQPTEPDQPEPDQPESNSKLMDVLNKIIEFLFFIFELAIALVKQIIM